MVVGSHPPDLCGVGDYASRLATALFPCRVTLLTSGRGGSASGGRRTLVRREMGDWGFGEWSRFLARVDEEAPDVVHFQYPSRGFGWKLLPILLPLLLRLVRPHLPQVVTLHEFRGLNPLRQASYFFFTLFARAVVTPSSGVRHDLEDEYRWLRGKTTVIPVGSFLPERGKALSGPVARPLLVFPGFLLERKGPFEALEAAAILSGRFPGLRLVFASEGDSHAAVARRLQALARKRGIASRVDFTGRLTPSELAGWMKRADLVLLPFHDGASTRRSTLASALTLKVPVVTTEGPGLLEEFRHGGVLLARPRDAVSLAGVIETHLKDPGSLRRLREKLPHLAALFDWGRIAAAHRALYERAREGGL